jgi:hypothetical protein
MAELNMSFSVHSWIGVSLPIDLWRLAQFSVEGHICALPPDCSAFLLLPAFPLAVPRSVYSPDADDDT